MSQTVPRWAILAFDRTDGCPEWWIRYSQADGRFLMGASSGIWATWWQNSIIYEELEKLEMEIQLILQIVM